MRQIETFFIWQDKQAPYQFLVISVKVSRAEKEFEPLQPLDGLTYKKLQGGFYLHKGPNLILVSKLEKINSVMKLKFPTLLQTF